MRAARLALERVEEPYRDDLPTLNVGCSGWFYWHWRGLFYPQELPTNRWFAHYAQHFSTVELNAPFYSWPTTNAVNAWLRQAGSRDFVYTVKACEMITHVKRFTGTKTLIKDFDSSPTFSESAWAAFCFSSRPAIIIPPPV